MGEKQSVSGNQTPWEQASDWFGRTIAIVVVMVAPGLAGGWLDGKFGTRICTLFGFGLGIFLAVVALIVFTRLKPAVGDSFKAGEAGGLKSMDRDSQDSA